MQAAGKLPDNSSGTTAEGPSSEQLFNLLWRKAEFHNSLINVKYIRAFTN